MRAEKTNNKIIKTIALISFVLLLICCSDNSKIKSDFDRNIEVVIDSSKKDGNSDYMYMYLFKEGSTKDSLVYFDIDELRRLYFGKHIEEVTAKLTFEEFIRSVISNKINLECSTLGECFKKDEKIEEDYKLIGFKKFKEKYTNNTLSDNKVILNTSALTEDEILNVIYIFYLNGYFTVWADYEGFYMTMNEIIIDREEENPLIEP